MKIFVLFATIALCALGAHNQVPSGIFTLKECDRAIEICSNLPVGTMDPFLEKKTLVVYGWSMNYLFFALIGDGTLQAINADQHRTAYFSKQKDGYQLLLTPPNTNRFPADDFFSITADASGTSQLLYRGTDDFWLCGSGLYYSAVHAYGPNCLSVLLQIQWV